MYELRMPSGTVSDARASLAEILERVADGDQITLTRHGVPVAVVVRPDVLRSRRTAALHAGADELRKMVDASRSAPLDQGAMTAQQADDLVRIVHADRDTV